MKTCWLCMGVGKLLKGGVCSVCGGTGQVEGEPERGSQESWQASGDVPHSQGHVVSFDPLKLVPYPHAHNEQCKHFRPYYCPSDDWPAVPARCNLDREGRYPYEERGAFCMGCTRYDYGSCDLAEPDVEIEKITFKSSGRLLYYRCPKCSMTFRAHTRVCPRCKVTFTGVRTSTIESSNTIVLGYRCGRCGFALDNHAGSCPRCGVVFSGIKDVWCQPPAAKPALEGFRAASVIGLATIALCFALWAIGFYASRPR